VVKVSSAWKQMLYAGKLGGYDLARILSASGPKINDNLKNFSKFTNRSSDILENKNFYPSLLENKSLGARNKIFRENLVGLGKGTRNRKVSVPTQTASGQATESRHELGNTIRVINKGLREPANKDSALQIYDKVKKAYRPEQFTYRDLKSGIRDMKEEGNLGYNAIFGNLNKRKTHKLWGVRTGEKGPRSTSIVDEIQSGRGANAFFFNPGRGFTTSRKAPYSVSRHEVAHGKHTTSPELYEKKVVPQLTKMIYKNPHLSDILNNKINFSESVAQTIAGSGGSRSAQRFNQQYRAYAKNNLWDSGESGMVPNRGKRKALTSLVDKADVQDPTGVTGSVLTQLHKNYQMPFPSPKKVLPIRYNVNQ
jgi:hypothetical protein